MQQKTTIINHRELFKDLPAGAELQDRKGSFEMHWELSDDFGKGFMYLIKFRPGLLLGIGDYYLRENIRAISERTDASFAIDFTLSGNVECAFDYIDGSENIYTFAPERSSITSRPIFRSLTNYRGKDPIRMMGIYLEPFLLKTLMEEEYESIPAGMHDIIDGNNEKHYYHPLTTTIATKMIVQEIFNCPYQGNLKRLWLEGKTLELIAHSLAQLGITKERHNKVFVLQPGEIERVLNAKDILIHNIENPHSLLELANIVGINKNKLNQGFRESFGTSVFDYLRICRLERGRELLKSGQKSVTEVALDVGYAQQSNFTKAFKKHFGTNPRNYLR